MKSYWKVHQYFDRFGCRFSFPKPSKKTFKINNKSIENLIPQILWKRGSLFIHFESQNPSQNESKSIQNHLQISKRPQAASKSLPRRLQGVKTSPDRFPKTAPIRPKTAPRHPKTNPRAFQDRPKTLQDSLKKQNVGKHKFEWCPMQNAHFWSSGGAQRLSESTVNRSNTSLKERVKQKTHENVSHNAGRSLRKGQHKLKPRPTACPSRRQYALRWPQDTRKPLHDHSKAAPRPFKTA